MKKSTLIVLSIIFMVSLSQVAFAGDPQPQYGGVLRIANSRSPAIFGYPAKIQGYSGKFVYTCIEPLCSADKTGRFAPTKLATAYELGQDGKSLTFTLRKGVKFHDGTDFNAKAAKWNLEKVKAANKPGTGLWTSIDIIDDYTIRVGIKKYQNNWPSLFGTASKMISPTSIEKNGEEWAYHHPVGTGPFKFKGYKREVFLEYERYDDYWGGKPFLDGIKYLFIKDPMTQMASFLRGEVDILETRSNKVLSDLKAKGYKIDSQFLLSVVLQPDSANPDSPFADERVRKAVEYAIDRPAIVKAVSYGFWKPSDQACIEGFVGYVPNLAGRRYNPKKAKELLAEAGYPNGFKAKFILEPRDKDAAVAMQAYLKNVGITTDLDVVTRARAIEYDIKGWNKGMIVKTWGSDPNHPHTLARFLEVGGIRTKSLLRPKGWGETLDAALTATDFEAYKAATQKAVKFIHDKAMVIPLFVNPECAILQPYVYNTNFFTPRLMEWSSGKAYISK